MAFSAPLLHLETGAFPSINQRDQNTPVYISSLVAKAQARAGESFIPLGYLGANAEIATNVEMIYGLSDRPENGGETQIVTFDSNNDSVIDALYLDRTITHQIIDLHYELLLGDTGEVIVAIIGLLMSALALAGIYLW